MEDIHSSVEKHEHAADQKEATQTLEISMRQPPPGIDSVIPPEQNATPISAIQLMLAKYLLKRIDYYL